MKSLLLIVLTLASLTPWHPVAAHEVGVGDGDGDITVYEDMSACATVTFPAPTTFAGQFSAAGAIAGPGGLVGAVRGAREILVTDGTTWFGCVTDAYAGASIGAAEYTLTVSALTGDFVAVELCTVRQGVVSCT